MSDVQVIYRGPSGCLIADGVELHRDEVAVMDLDHAVRVQNSLPDHDLSILGPVEPAEGDDAEAPGSSAPSSRRRKAAEDEVPAVEEAASVEDAEAAGSVASDGPADAGDSAHLSEDGSATTE